MPAQDTESQGPGAQLGDGTEGVGRGRGLGAGGPPDLVGPGCIHAEAAKNVGDDVVFGSCTWGAKRDWEQS